MKLPIFSKNKFRYILCAITRGVFAKYPYTCDTLFHTPPSLDVSKSKRCVLFYSTKFPRKFTRTGTPIHRNNCRCTFCLSTATEVSELSSSPILEMPSRPRKRLLSHELDACQDACSKKRKSLFPGEDGLTVSQWLGSNFAAQQQLSQEPSSQESVPNTQIQELDPNTQIQAPVLTTLIQESVPSSQTQTSACINRSEELLSSNKTD